jgi:hypothetical protein
MKANGASGDELLRVHRDALKYAEQSVAKDDKSFQTVRTLCLDPPLRHALSMHVA